MLTSWGSTSTADLVAAGEAGDQIAPVVADSGGDSFGVAWTSAAGVTVRFFDTIGHFNPAPGTLQVSDGLYGTTQAASKVGKVAMTAGGSTIGYGVVWEERSAVDAAAPSILRGRYVGDAGPIGGEFSIAAEAGFNQHDAAMSGYGVDDAAGKPIVDGFNVVWTSTSASDPLTAQQRTDGYGRIMFQRFEVSLDAKKTPIGPPQAAGLDGRSGAGSNAAVNIGNEAGSGAAVFGRNPTTTVTANNETVVTWIDTDNHVHARVYSAAGAVIDGGVAGASLANLGTVAAGGMVKVLSLAGAGFVVAWAGTAAGGTPVIMGQVFANGAAAGTFAAGPAIVLQSVGATFTGDFSLATLLDTNGFALSWGQTTTSTGTDLFAKHFTAAGGSDGVVSRVNTTLSGDQSGVSLASLGGDRVVAVYQDNSGAGLDVKASILDSRTVNVTLIGDDGGNGRIKLIADTLVGTVGDDSIDGRGADDALYGALGNDLITGGAGNDAIDGGGGTDTAVYSGVRANYVVTHLGADIFTVQDIRGGGPDGVDTIRGIEKLRFTDGTVDTATFIPVQGITPTAWGMSNKDGNGTPDLGGTPDVDGFIVNHAPRSKAGVQTNPSVADSIGEFLGVVWETPDSAGQTHIRGQFYDVVGNFNEFIPNAIDISDGKGIESNAVIVSGGANSGWGVAWEQFDSANDKSATLRSNFLGATQLTGPEFSVFDEGERVDQHDAALAGLFLDKSIDIRTPPSPRGIDAKTVGDGYTVAWVSTDLDASGNATNVVGDARYGRIMMQNFEVPLDALGNPGAPAAAGQNKLRDIGVSTAGEPHPDNDKPFWVGAETGGTGFIGRNPTVVGTHGFETALIWIESNGQGGERVAGRIYDDLGQVVSAPSFDVVSGSTPIAPGTDAIIVQAGAVNLGVVWVVADAASPSGYTIMGNMYAPTGAGINGTGFGFSAPAPFVLTYLPVGIAIADLDLHATGISGEDSNDLVVSWKVADGQGGSDMMAQHIKVALDPATGTVLAMSAEGNTVTVSAETAGNQDQGSLAGLLGDRFVAVYHDQNSGYTDGDDIVARIIDTRDTVHPVPITGDLVRNGVPQARRDVLIGTNGNDVIRGDISDSNGLTDTIYAGLGDDIITGGPGITGAAGAPEFIDGGDGNDIAVYTGRRQDYSITINGDGSYEVIDLRPIQNAQGVLLQNDGIDNLYNIETIRFLNLTQANPNPATPPAPTDIKFGFPGTPPASPANYDGTPVAWSLTDTSQYKEILASVDPTTGVGGQAGVQGGIAVTGLQTETAMAWVSGGTQVWGARYEIQGDPDPLFSPRPVQLTDGTSAGNTVSDLDIAMTAGLGFTAVWESTKAGDSEIHLRFGSTATNVVNDPAAGVPGGGFAGGEITVVGSTGSGAQVAVDPTVQGYEIVNTANDTLEYGFHVGYALKDDAASAYGVIKLARYEIPVYDLRLDAAGNPVLDANGNGILALGADGKPIPSTDLSRGAESAPISIGLDGLRGTADDSAAFNLGTDGSGNPIRGRDPSLATLHDGQLVVSYIGTDEKVHLKIFVPTIDQTGDRDTSGAVAVGITQYHELALPFDTTLGTVAAGQSQYVVGQQNGSFGVFWAEAASGGSGQLTIKAVIYPGAGTSWNPTPVLTLETGVPAGSPFQITPTGVDPGGLEDGYFVTWETAGGIRGQRFDMIGTAVGHEIAVGDPQTGTPSGHSASGIEDGRMIFGYEDGSGDVSIQFLDTREPGVPLIGPREGAPRDVIVGTVGDDALDGRALGDQLFGGLGNDLLTLGSGADIGDGGAGNDTIIGGTGQDQLIGGAGDDLLWGGVSGPADAKFDRDLRAGLTAAGISAAVIAAEPGADMISGGEGRDTISFQGEFGRFDINLATGIVMGDRSGQGFILEDVIGAIVDDGAGGTIFRFVNDVENAKGGIGNDTITGNAGDNVLDGGGGNNVIDGGAGADTVVMDGNLADFQISFSQQTQTFIAVKPAAGGDPARTDTIRNVEAFQFLDGTRTAVQLGGSAGAVAANDTVATLEEQAVVIDVLANDGTAPGLRVASINGTAIVAGGAAVAVANGSVSLAATGRLSFTPSANFFGPATFAYQAVDSAGRSTGANVTVNVTNVNDAPTAISFNGNPALAAVPLAENSAAGTVVATLATVDPDNAFGVVNDTFTYSLANDGGGRFEIVGNQVRVKSGAVLDFEAATHDYSLAVTANDGHNATVTRALAVNLTNVNEAPVNVALSATSFAETAANGTAIGTFSATDPEGGALRFGLTNDADGRFVLIKDGSSYKLAVAENLLIDHRADGDANHVYSITASAIDASGLATSKVFSVTATGVAENRILGTTAANTLNGTTGNDYIDGGTNKDTMTGGLGNDVYVVDDGGDKVTENANQGQDAIYTSLTSFDLGKAANVETLVFTGTAAFTGKAGATGASIFGGAGADRLDGGAGADILSGRGGADALSGGAGNDVLIGGAGNDSLTGDTGSDSFVFRPGFGSDTIRDFGATAGANHDILEFSSAIFASFVEVQSAMQQVGADIVITASGGDVVTLQKVALVNIDATDFRFV